MKTATNKKSSSQAPSEGYKAGLAMRKKVLGDDYVERSFANADDLNMPFQELATEFAWGKVWTRPGLTLKERSLATLSMCIALNRPAEIKIHLRGAVRNGVSREELRDGGTASSCRGEATKREERHHRISPAHHQTGEPQRG